MASIRDSLEEGVMLLEPEMFDEAIVGMAERCGMAPAVIYDRALVLGVLMRDMSEEDAEEYYSFNIAGAYVGESTPIFLDRCYAY